MSLHCKWRQQKRAKYLFQAETTVIIQNNRADRPLLCVTAWEKGVGKQALPDSAAIFIFALKI